MVARPTRLVYIRDRAGTSMNLSGVPKVTHDGLCETHGMGVLTDAMCHTRMIQVGSGFDQVP